ncbi:EthD family reductase [Roseateles violae]|uniref:EthD family reductase n=1 Tax=Roseateles violae TaxID=3058042 RepID=A0ABT8DNU9_9BURK|nr:EthD family reductase [Pelomonas sp. PFR6]MDN3919673.1 EthD family reductase [Pelomonas sp. PFR6]
MAKLIALYKKPANPAAFDDYYFTRHIPLAKKIRQLRGYEVNATPLATPAGPSETYHLAAILSFDSMADLQAALGSPEGAATAADLGNFASGGVELLFFDTKEV